MNATEKAALDFARIASAWDGMDLTGEGAEVPKGHVRIIPGMAEDYRRGPYVIRHDVSLKRGDTQVRAILINMIETFETLTKKEEDEHARARNSYRDQVRGSGPGDAAQAGDHATA